MNKLKNYKPAITKSLHYSLVTFYLNYILNKADI